MFSETFYLIRAKSDGRYLVARPEAARDSESAGYLILFREHHESLSYLNTHAEERSAQFSVEPIPGSQLKPLIRRWGFAGIGLVQDPLLPKLEFLVVEPE
jgi:hypothetical protein